MSVLNHIVYVRPASDSCQDFLHKLSQEGLTCDLLAPDEDLDSHLKQLRPILVLVGSDLALDVRDDVIRRVKSWSPNVPSILMLPGPSGPDANFVLPTAADGVCYLDVPSAHLALALRGAIRSSFTIQELMHSNRKLNEISITDALTGLHNRGYMIDRLNLEFKRSCRNREPLSCLMVDLDHFKQVNDTYGHKFGDVVLQAVSGRLKQLIREIDIFGRYGGEEFLIILPGTSLLGAGHLAEKLRDGLATERITYEYFTLHMTASFGVASTENPDVITADHLLQLSDRALYRAKDNGRNRVCIAGADEGNDFSRPMRQTPEPEDPEVETQIDVVSVDAENLRCVELIAAASEFKAMTHVSVDAFFHAFKDREPQLVLVDQTDERMDGIGLCRRLKEQIQDLFIPVLLLLPPGDDALLDEALAAGVDGLITGSLNEKEFVARLRSLVRLKKLHDRWRNTHQDLTMARTRLVKAERLTALGEMATGVAHDFNNVLSTVLGRTRLIRQRAENPEVLRSLEVIERAASDGAATIRRIQEFSRSTTDHVYESLNLGQIVHDCVQMTRTRWKDEAEMKGVGYRFRTEFPGPMPIIGSPAELREVITNLIMNALDAMPEGGEMFFDGAILDKEVLLTVRDTGKGMDDQVLKRVFDPFFSTKKGEGTGLGLSVAYGIIARHNGRIECSSSPGEETLFRIYLPHRPEEYAAKAAQAKDRSVSSKGKQENRKRLNILVVDDEAPICEIFYDVLTDEGHKVSMAESGEKALDLFADGNFDLVFTDLSMPGMNGWDLALRIHQAAPEIPIVITSGWGGDFNRDRLESHGIRYVLPKPVPFESIHGLTQYVASGRAITLDDAF